jgi:transcriptional regulator with GAF, ATPase, and Fis domain
LTSLHESFLRQLKFEELISELATHFAGVESEKVDGEIKNAQRRVCESLSLDRSVLFQLTDDGTMLVSTHGWARDGFGLPPTFGTADFPFFSAKLFRGEIIRFNSHADVPREHALDIKNLASFGPKSNITVPLRAAGRTFGAIAFDTLANEVVWTDAHLRQLSLVGQIFADAIVRKRLFTELRRSLDEVRALKEQLQNENFYLKEEVKSNHGSGIIGRSDAIRNVLKLVDQVAALPSTVLILGETGTGKELVAAAIHEASGRKSRPMIKVNCAAIPAALMESELFGREKGAYTGALSRQPGRFELANGSTIFLDEISELPIELQAKLLRVLQEKQIERLGSPKPIAVDVRIVAATNRNLEAEVRAGRFREDLFYRLHVFPITIPPLRERSEDIPLLVNAFLSEFARAQGKQLNGVSRASLDALLRYHWPGNVRELRNVVERAVIVANGPRVSLDLPHTTATPARGMALNDVEREHILEVLKLKAWRIRGANGAASILGLKPTTLESRMKKLGIRKPA